MSVKEVEIEIEEKKVKVQLEGTLSNEIQGELKNGSTSIKPN